MHQQGGVTEMLHDVGVADPWRWLGDGDDPRVSAWEALGERPNRPIPPRMETGAGHGAGKSTARQVEEAVDQWSFLRWQLGMLECVSGQIVRGSKTRDETPSFPAIVNASASEPKRRCVPSWSN